MQNKIYPDASSTTKAIDVCGGNLNIISYLKNSFEKNINNSGQEDSFELPLQAISDTEAMAIFVKAKREGLYEKIYNGTITQDELDKLSPNYFNYQDYLAGSKLADIDQSIVAERFKDVKVIYEINDNSEFIRGYLSDGKQLDPSIESEGKIIDLLDQSFHSWLVSNNMTSYNGVIYDSTKLDKKGKYKEKINSEDFAKLISSSEKGLNATLRKQNKDLSISVNRQSDMAKQSTEAAAPAA